MLATRRFKAQFSKTLLLLYDRSNASAAKYIALEG